MKRNLIYLTLSLGISSITLLTDRYVISIPDWLAIILILLSTVFLTLFFLTNWKKESNQ